MPTFGRSTSKDEGTNTGEPQNWGALELCSIGMGGVADPKIHASPDVRYHVKFGSCDQRCAHKYTKESLKLGSAGTPSPWSVDVADHLKQITPRIIFW